MLAAPEGTFVEAGGHAMSGGFAVADHAIFDVRELLNKAYAQLEQSTHVVAPLGVDARLTLSAVHRNTWGIISKCAPFGEGYSKPVFIFEHITVEEIKQFGKTKEHIELTLSDDTAKKVKAIQFFGHEDEKIKKLTPWTKISLIGHLEESRFKSYPEYRIKIVDIV
jgi:single-stranded-DNA-specific exonuclease